MGKGTKWLHHWCLIKIHFFQADRPYKPMCYTQNRYRLVVPFPKREIWSYMVKTDNKNERGFAPRSQVVLFAIFCYILLYFAIFCHILPYFAIFCYILLYLAILGYTLLYLAISCYTLVYLAILCHTWLYFAILGYTLPG